MQTYIFFVLSRYIFPLFMQNSNSKSHRFNGLREKFKRGESNSRVLVKQKYSIILKVQTHNHVSDRASIFSCNIPYFIRLPAFEFISVSLDRSKLKLSRTWHHFYYLSFEFSSFSGWLHFFKLSLSTLFVFITSENVCVFQSTC